MLDDSSYSSTSVYQCILTAESDSIDRAHISVTIAVVTLLSAVAGRPDVDRTKSISSVLCTSLQSLPGQRLRSINFEEVKQVR